MQEENVTAILELGTLEHSRALPPEVEAAFAAIMALPPEEAARVMANVAHRAAAHLHGLANREAKSRKGAPEWARWARLTNAARAQVLQASACRDAAKDL